MAVPTRALLSLTSREALAHVPLRSPSWLRAPLPPKPDGTRTRVHGASMREATPPEASANTTAPRGLSAHVPTWAGRALTYGHLFRSAPPGAGWGRPGATAEDGGDKTARPFPERTKVKGKAPAPRRRLGAGHGRAPPRSAVRVKQGHA